MKVFNQNRIALIWDFDKTLIPDYMQKPLFEKYNIDESEFWNEVNSEPIKIEKQGYRVNHEIYYLNHILKYLKNDKFGSLNNKTLGELGGEIDFFDGVIDFFKDIKRLIKEDPKFSAFEIQVEHYIVSTGLSEMIKGSKIFEHVDGIWGCEFLDEENDGEKRLSQIIYTIDNTTKTKAIFEINKGVHKYPEDVHVNSMIPIDERYIPFSNMIYIADGPSDIPAFSVVKKLGGKTFAVYKEEDPKSFKQADNLRNDKRIDMYGPANYTRNSLTRDWLTLHVKNIAMQIYESKTNALKKSGEGLPKHITDSTE